MKQTCMILAVIFISTTLYSQPIKQKYKLYMDIAHKQYFWADPSSTGKMSQDEVDRVKYMTGELQKTLKSLNTEIAYLKKEIKASDLADCKVLFIPAPSSRYTAGEVAAISDYVKQGGRLYLVMDEDYWGTLKQTNVNDLIKPFGIEFGADNPDAPPGGYTKAGAVTPKPVKIPYHGTRSVKGGTPFLFSDKDQKIPFGVYKQVPNGGKIIVMGDGMVSLYMTSWEGVNDYQCQEYMHDAFSWLMK